MKKLLDLDRRAFYVLYYRFRLTPYSAACLAWLKGLAVGALIASLLLP
jgi:hypothetical protein